MLGYYSSSLLFGSLELKSIFALVIIIIIMINYHLC